MIVNFSFKHLGATEALKAYTTEKSQKLAKYFKGRTHVTWSFDVQKTLQVAHCHLVGNDMDYFGEASSEDLYKSIDMAIVRIEKQLRKHKEIVKDHLHRTGRRKPTKDDSSLD